MDKVLSIIGEIIIDITLSLDDKEHKMRLGGIAHAARAAWAAGYKYEMYYIAPDYLEEEIKQYMSSYGCIRSTKIGSINRSPGVILIGDPKETGDQKYSLLMKDSSGASIIDFELSETTTDILIFPGSYSLKTILEILSKSNEKTEINIDIANISGNLESLNELGYLDRRFKHIFNSTSFHINGNKDDLIASIRSTCLDKYCDVYIMKENRGGGRLYSNDGDYLEYPAYLRDIVHSVGVGDCFDIIFIASEKTDYAYSLREASYLASEYAATSFPDDLRKNFEDFKYIKEYLLNIPGVRLAWEDRKMFKIYVAAPDFDWVDDKFIRAVENSLEYHNFKSLLPIQINGQINNFEDTETVSKVFEADISLILEADMIIGVIINNDHGTLIEIGYAKGLGKPVVVYDPNNLSVNPMLTHLPDTLSSDLDIIINEVYKIASKR